MSALVKISNAAGRLQRFEGLQAPATRDEPGETVWELPEDQGEGAFRRFDLTGGVSLSLSRCRMKRTYRAEVDEGKPSLALVFVLDGSTGTGNSSLKQQVTTSAGQGYLHYLPDPLIKREIAADHSLQAVSIKMPISRLYDLIGDQIHRLPPALRQAMEGDEPTRFFRHITITPKLRAPLRQIAANPYQGLVRLFFWESKVLELLAYTLEQFGETGGQEELNRRDRDRAHQARELLCRDLQYPPSLADLAKTVGTSHAKLNRVFRRAFGCTVFAFIREQRLDWAAALLTDERLSITDVAFATGFCSSSHFAACFLKRFGMQPSRYRSMAIG